MNYTKYHVHDFTSNVNGYMDSCTDYYDYIKLAKNEGDKAIAFSNHGGIYDWVKKKQACDKAGIKYIHGVELYLCEKLEDSNRGWHIGLYAKNMDGVLELNTLMSKSTSKGKEKDFTDRHFYFNPRISFEELFKTSNNIIVTTACLASALWKLSNGNSDDVARRDRLLKWLSKNKDRCFLEIQYHNCDDQKEYNKMLYKWSLEYGIPLIAGTDTHSSNKYKDECRTILQKAKNKKTYDDEQGFDLIWKTYDEVVEAFLKQGVLPREVYIDAIHNTNALADMVETFELDKSFKYPALYGKDANKKFKKLIQSKLQEKIDRKEIDINKVDEYKRMLNEEFVALSKQGMESFMIFMSELMTWCRENDIHSSPCRGSVGGSMVAYVTDITDVDPFVWKTVFSRFCNAERISLADIDQDFAGEDRQKVYDYIISRFGNENVSRILTLGTIQDRGSIDILAKGLDYDDLDNVKKIKNTFDEAFNQYTKIINENFDLTELAETEDLTSKSPTFDDHSIYIRRLNNKETIKKLSECKEKWDTLRDENKELFYYFDGIKGTVVSKGMHAAGMIGSPITLYDNLSVVYKDGDESCPVSSCAMKAVDSLNYVKFDILGLKTIGIIQDTFRMAGVPYKYAYQMNWNDENVWHDMIRCNSGIFQFEGDYAHDLLKTAIKSRLRQSKEPDINLMSMVNAALRPSGKSYRNKLVNGEINKNPSDEIDNLLESNQGFLIFQEDTIKFLTDICGFSGALADTTRRAIGKKDIVLLNEQLPKILEGYCKNSKNPRDVAEKEAQQFIQIVSDSSDYQFGYNHSTGYSMVGYMASYCRTYHTIEFITSYFNWCENDSDYANGMKMVEEYGLKLFKPTFRKSKGKYFYDKEENTIYKGIGSVKYLNDNVGDELYELKNNVYSSFMDLLHDIKEHTTANTKQVNILIMLDFFREFGSIGKLLECSRLFNEMHDKQQLKREKVENLMLDKCVVAKFSDKVTDKTFLKIRMRDLLRNIENKTQESQPSVIDLVKFQNEHLGYIDIKDKRYKGFTVVADIALWSKVVKMKLYALANGNTLDVMMYKDVYIRSIVGKDEIIKIDNFYYQPEQQRNEQGKYVDIPGTKVLWLSQYHKVNI